MFEIHHFADVVCHPYRTARVTDIVFEIDRRSDAAKVFEHDLAERANVRPDNHVVYTVTTWEGSAMHFWCTDFKICVGTKLVSDKA